MAEIPNSGREQGPGKLEREAKLAGVGGMAGVSGWVGLQKPEYKLFLLA